MMKKHGHQVKVIVDDDRMSFEDYKDHLDDWKPDLFGFTCMSFQWQAVQKRAVWVKEARDIPVPRAISPIDVRR